MAMIKNENDGKVLLTNHLALFYNLIKDKFISRDEIATTQDIEQLFATLQQLNTYEKLNEKFQEGGEIKLTNNIIIPAANTTEESRTKITKDAFVDFGDNMILVPAELGGSDSSNWAGLYADGDKITVILNGNEGGIATATATENLDCPYCVGVLNGATVIINGGHYKGSGSAIYVRNGSCIINGGFFEAYPWQNGEKGELKPWTLNCQNDTYKKGLAHIIVHGGTYVNFDPSNPKTDDAETYVDANYQIVSETKSNGDVWYSVVKKN